MSRIAAMLCVVSSIFSASAFSALQVSLEPVVKKLKEPVFVTTAPGEGSKLYIVEQKGRILTFENGKLNEKPFLDIRSKVKFGGEMGLLSVAFHPNFQKNRRYFVNYTPHKQNIKTIVAEYQAGSTKEEKIILKLERPLDQLYGNHNGGQLAFDKEGWLYIGTGDGGSAGDPHNNSQNMNSYMGKMLRIGINGKSPYEVPADNPFKSGSGKPEIWALGLRNPWRFSFDRETGALFTGDVGQGTLEEIDIVEKGHNYGWRVMEGTLCFNPAQGCDKKDLTLPIFEYGRDEGGSITGGYVYRGNAIPEMKGTYLYGDYNTGRIWGLQYDQKLRRAGKNELLIDSEQPVASFGEDVNGEILVVVHPGTIYRVVKGQRN